MDREHWPAACILSDRSPQTIDTLHWAHKEPHTPGQGNKEPFERLQRGKACSTRTLRPGFFFCSLTEDTDVHDCVEENDSSVVLLLSRRRCCQPCCYSFNCVHIQWRCFTDVCPLFSFLSPCHKVCARCRGESPVRVISRPSALTN